LQVFVANPNKSQPVVEILHNNRDKLLKYLDDFHNDRGGRAGGRQGGMEGGLVVVVWMDGQAGRKRGTEEGGKE
jgi:hypothetical protein